MNFILKKFGWSRQKPRKRASQRNEDSIQQWHEDWPDVEKAEETDQTIVLMNEAGFRLLPSVMSTYAPRGKTPVLDVSLTWDHLSVMGAITSFGQLLTWIQDRAVKGKDVVRFLNHVLAQFPGNILLIWDGLPAHRSKTVKTFLAQGAAKRLYLLQLPPYAPELNPQEGVWHYLKNVELKNVCCHSLDELRLELRRAIGRLRFKGDVLLGCIRQPSCYL